MLYGCAAQPVDLPEAATPGHIATRPGRPGFVVAAPHGSSDINTDEIAVEIARRTGFGLVVATGFSMEPDATAPAGRRYQVNRPLEGVPGRPAAEHVPTDAALRVYQAYEKRVLEAAQGPLRFYAEIHGNNRKECAGQIEIATVGVDREFALRLRTLAELIRDAYLRSNREIQRLDVLIEPVDAVTYRASGAKRDGILRLPERALHIELPKCARRDWRETYTAILADFLTQAVAREMLERRRAEPEFPATIVFVTSVSAEMASPNRGEYCVSKAGLSMAARLFAARLAADGIPVYEVRPGIIATDMTAAVHDAYDRRIAEGLVPEKRWGQPEDVGRAVAALLRGDFPHATGTVVHVDGGLSLPRL